MQFKGEYITYSAFDSLVLDTVPVGHLTNAYVVAAFFKSTRSRATRANIAASLERLVVAGYLVRDDLAVTGAAPTYRRVR